MKIRAHLLANAVAILVLLVCETDAAEPGLVRVVATCQTHDPFHPWRKAGIQSRQGYGVLLRDGLIVTTEDLVRNHTMIEVSLARSGEKHPARVELSDTEVNLAVLKTAAPAPLSTLTPYPIAAAPPADGALTVLQFDETGELQEGDARIVKAQVSRLPNGGGSALMLQILTDLNVNARGAIAVSKGELAGVVMTYDPNSRIATILPYPILSVFLKDVLEAPYAGFPYAGFSWKELVDPAVRKYLHVPESGGGVMVVATVPGTGSDQVLRPEDVILEWDGQRVDNQGYYADPVFGRMEFVNLIKGSRRPGDTVDVKVVRDGNAQTLKLLLARRNAGAALIPDNTAMEPVDYVVEGGLVIRELTVDYLLAFGENWESRANSRLVHLYLTGAAKPERPGDRVVLLSHVLPDPINAGYEHLGDEVLTSVNGEPIRNIRDVFRIAERDGLLTRFGFQSIGVDVVLNKQDLPEANRRIAEVHRIPSLRRRSDVPKK